MCQIFGKNYRHQTIMNWIKRAGLKVLSKKLKHKRWMSYVHNDFLIAKCATAFEVGSGKALVLRELI